MTNLQQIQDNLQHSVNGVFMWLQGQLASRMVETLDMSFAELTTTGHVGSSVDNHKEIATLVYDGMIPVSEYATAQSVMQVDAEALVSKLDMVKEVTGSTSVVMVGPLLVDAMLTATAIEYRIRMDIFPRGGI